MANRLASATSPYLRQHADNPVDWWAWGPEAFAEARRRDRPVLVSVGYSSCHWCHVMARESFADEAVGELLNDNFVSIKVDREEHPDVDAVFMHATQALTGQGGWPMTVFCTPDGQPFFAGTYFPPTPRSGLPSFTQLVTALAEAWRERRSEVIRSAGDIVTQLAGLTGPPAEVIPENLAPYRLLQLLHSQYDTEHGGFGRAPKFPQAPVLDAMFVRTDPLGNDRALFNCETMARGGIHDQVGGGFHRYAVDEGWEVPHFEKMLYDNALLLGTYTRAWLRATPDDGTEQRELFERVVRGIVGWLADDLALPGGGFAASLDADSVDEATGEHVEGAYYLWSPQLFDEFLGKDSKFAQGLFHVTHGGNLPMGAHAPTDGSGLSTLQLHGNPHPGRLANVLEALKAIRGRRPHPARDDKVVTAWNGLLVDSLVNAAMVFDEPDWLATARAAADHLWRVHWDEQRRILHRSSLASGDTSQLGPDGVTSDYAAAALGFCRLAGALGDAAWLARATELLDRAIELFGAADGGFHDAVGTEELFERPRRLDDEALPSANSLMVTALRVAGRLADRRDYADRADIAAALLRGVLAANPRYAGWALADLLAQDERQRGFGPAEVVIVDDSADPMSELARAAWRLAPWGSVVVSAPAGTEGFGDLFTGREQRSGSATAYVCHEGVCLQPTTDWGDLRPALWGSDHEAEPDLA